MTDRYIFKSNDEDLTFILKTYYHNDKLINEDYTTIGIFNFYFRNNIIIYKRSYVNLLECFSHLGGTAQLLFFIFQMINFINNRYIIHENSKTFFKINTGIDINYIEGNDIFFDKMRHLNSQNYRIKLYNNNNNINNNEDFTPKYMKNLSNKKKLKYSNYEYHGINQIINRPSRKNLGLLTATLAVVGGLTFSFYASPPHLPYLLRKAMLNSLFTHFGWAFARSSSICLAVGFLFLP